MQLDSDDMYSILIHHGLRLLPEIAADFLLTCKAVILNQISTYVPQALPDRELNHI